jgi:Family of unknown function (DUF6510)
MNGAMEASSERGMAGEPIAEALRLDGNAAGGILSEVFVPDLTAARATCAGCGTTRAVASLLVYAHGMGMIARCPGCDGVVMRIARTPTRVWLDMTGATSIVAPIAASPA